MSRLAVPKPINADPGDIIYSRLQRSGTLRPLGATKCFIPRQTSKFRQH